MQVDHHLESMPGGLFQGPLEIFQPGIQPAVIISQVAVRKLGAPIAAELETDQVHLPLRQRFEVVPGEIPLRRHHSAQPGQSGGPFGVLGLKRVLHPPEKGNDLQAVKVEIHRTGTFLQSQAEDA
ncbi:hypothetical protein SDC9_196435 [bioreactor metagenome]|uniref:Uncharacterized protein n=1 Tax=bioreactor metagenome TaxID=1076179 RepID=A0A645INK4_9ZZZZ